MPFFDAIRGGAAGAADTAFTVDRSLRFNDNDSPYFDFTPSGAGSNQMTFSFWVKRANLVDGVIFSSGTTNARGHIYFSSNQLYVQPFNSTGANGYIVSDMLFRDTSAWYHIVISLNNTTYSNMSSTINFYVNGQAITFTTSTTGTPSGGNRFNDSQAKHIGQFRPQSGSFFDGYLAEFNFIDGQVLDQSSFGETNSTTGQWVPKDTSGLTFGTNGFRLEFSDNSGTTATTLGKDSSGNGNNWTPNNFATNDAVKDSPTNNFSTLNSLIKGTSDNLSEGNLKGTESSEVHTSLVGTIGASSGKWYFEAKANTIGSAANATAIGVTSTESLAFKDSSHNAGESTHDAVYTAGAEFQGDSSHSSYGNSYSAGDIIGVAMDLDNQKLYFSKNGTFQNSGVPTSGSTGTGAKNLTADKTYVCMIGVYGGTVWEMNFGGGTTFTISSGNSDANGHGNFEYSVPTGYKALCSANLPDPTILIPNKHFDTLLWTGDGNDNRNITGLNFQPDWVWIKERSNSSSHVLTDSVRGIPAVLESNIDGAEDTSSGAADIVQSFNSDGFQVGTSGRANQSGQTNVGWNWNAGDTDGKTYTVTVVSDSGNKYRFDGYGTSAVTLDLAEGGTYIFNYPSAHPFRFSTTSDGTHGGGTEYTTGVTVLSSTSIQIVVAASAPTLYYYCSIHSGMGGAINTNSTLGSSNFDGSVQSTVKVNTTAGFSIVTYTGTAANATIGHGLGVKPDAYLVKRRTGGASHWMVFHKTTGNTKNLRLDISGGTHTTSNIWNNTDPTSSAINIGTSSAVNASGSTYVAYVLSGVAGYSKFGSYHGSGNADGPFIFTGFSPAWVMTVIYSSSGFDWAIHDSTRNPFNLVDRKLNPNNSAQEQTDYDKYDFLSNGFKPRVSDPGINASTGSYIYFAFAEAPFKNARAR